MSDDQHRRAGVCEAAAAAAVSKFVDRFHRIARWLKEPISSIELAVVCILVATLVGGVLVGWELR
jgi:hypothetical protein